MLIQSEVGNFKYLVMTMEDQCMLMGTGVTVSVKTVQSIVELYQVT